MSIDLRLGDYRDVLADVECDALIADLPYSARTHKGFRSGAASAGSVSEQVGIIEYPPITKGDSIAIAQQWAPRVRGWAVLFGDHTSWAWHEEAWSLQGWYTFAPVPWVRRDATPRFSGDGPQRSAEWIMVARPKRRVRVSGSRPGYYLVNRVEGAVNGSQIPGQKNLAGMRRLVGDYTEPGDVVCDITAGMGTTLIAASGMGRHAIGAEIDPETHAKAMARIGRGVQQEMFA